MISYSNFAEVGGDILLEYCRGRRWYPIIILQRPEAVSIMLQRPEVVSCYNVAEDVGGILL